MGDHRPLDDLADFFRDVAKIELVDPIDPSDLPSEEVAEIREYWHTVSDKRRGEAGFSMVAYRLAEHDIDSYLSVLVQRRATPSTSAFGYNSWIVSLDSAAWNLFSSMTAKTRKMIGHSPLISLDFLLKYLSFGPRRDQVSAGDGYLRVFQPTMFESVSPELIAAAEQIRSACSALPERQIQRRIRDGLDKQRMRQGDAQKGGLDNAYNVIRSFGSS